MQWITFVHILFTAFCFCDAGFSEGIESLSVHPLVAPQSIGTEFVFAFLSAHASATITENLYVLVSNQDPTQSADITITSSYPNFTTITTSVGPQNVSRITILPVNLQAQYPNTAASATTIENKGLRVVSSLPVTVYADNEINLGVSSDSMLILPVCQLSTNYETVGDESRFLTQNIISMVATQDNTWVRFLRLGTWVNVTLNALQVLSYSHVLYSLSATEVESGKPIAVISGNVCGIGIENHNICDHEAVMLVPEQSWGTKFPMVPFAGSNFNEFILTANQTTNVYQDTTLIRTILHNQYLIFNASVIYIWTDVPVEVVQVGKRAEGTVMTGAPFFANLPPTEQFISGPVQFLTNAQLANRTQHYVRITTMLNGIGTIAIDGSVPSALLYTRVGRSTIYFYNARIQPGMHTITTTSPTTTYSAMVYGYGDSTGYGFAAGLNLPATNGACASKRYEEMIQIHHQ